jgi:Do/DeqQ family serine protease
MAKHVNYWVLLLCCLVSSLAAITLDRVFAPRERTIVREMEGMPDHVTQDLLNNIRPRTFLSAEPTDFTAAAGRVTASVVFLRMVEQYRPAGPWDTNRHRQESTGSGVIISADGLIATNNHVIENSREITVVLSDRREFPAEIVGVDRSTDLALLRIRASGLPYLEFGNSDSLRVGEWVLAIGNPFSLQSTVTAGIVSAKGRSIDILEGEDRIESFIQTDAVVNPGNSGGALVNSNGELIGINTAIVTQTGRYEGYSFAVPGNLARKILRDLRDYGEVQRGMLGAYVEPIDNYRAQRLGLARAEGVLITRLRRGGSAEEGGLREGDVLVGINGIRIRTRPQMQEQISRYAPGNQITVTYIRDGVETETSLVLKNKNNRTSVLAVNEKAESLLHELGFEIRDLNVLESERLGVNGIKVISIFRNSPIERTNMEVDFVVTHLNENPIRSAKQFIRELYSAEGEVLLSGIYESYPGEYYYTFAK